VIPPGFSGDFLWDFSSDLVAVDWVYDVESVQIVDAAVEIGHAAVEIVHVVQIVNVLHAAAHIVHAAVEIVHAVQIAHVVAHIVGAVAHIERAADVVCAAEFACAADFVAAGAQLPATVSESFAADDFAAEFSGADFAVAVAVDPTQAKASDDPLQYIERMRDRQIDLPR
jgi:hypothetical protein